MFDGLRVQHRSPEPSFDPRTTNQAGEDGPPHDEPARARLRAEAVAWLRAALAAPARRLDAAAAPEVAGTLAHWARDPDLAGLRDEGELARLPEAERAATSARSCPTHADALRARALAASRRTP